MPTVFLPGDLSPAANKLYERIIAPKGGRASGAFDLMAWRDGQTIFLEYKGPQVPPNRNETGVHRCRALCLVSENDLFVVSALDD